MTVVDERKQRCIHLAGRLAETQVHELLRACGPKTASVVLMLGDLISVDAVGLDALRSLKEGGATLRDVPAYIQLKLDALSARQRQGDR